MPAHKSTEHPSTDTRSAVSPAHLAQRWDCCRQTVYNMIHDGQLHSFKVRNRRLIPLSEIERIESGS